MMEEQQQEKVVLPIVGIVLGVLGTILAFISGVRLFGLALAIIGLIVIVVSIVVNQKRKKLLTYVGLALTIIAAVLAMVLHGNEPAPASQEKKTAAKKIDAEDESVREKKKSDDAKAEAFNEKMTEEALEENAKMNLDNDASAWTKEYFDQLVVSEEINGDGGAKLADVEAVVGKPSLESDVDAEELKVRVVSWFSSTDDNDYLLIFVEQENGDWRLIDKSIESGDNA